MIMKPILSQERKSTNSVAHFIQCLLSARDLLHKKHWATNSFSAHLGLEELYTKLPDYADELVEKHQGFYGELLNFSKIPPHTINNAETPLELATYLLNYVIENRGVFGDNSMLQNIVDELVGDIAKAKYKLQFLS